MSKYGSCKFGFPRIILYVIYRGFNFVQVLDFICPGIGFYWSRNVQFLGQKMVNVQVFGIAHLVTLSIVEPR